MPIELSLMLVFLLLIVLVSLLKLEKLVRMTFWSYLMLLFSLSLGTLIVQRATLLHDGGSEKLLGLAFSDIANFLLNAQPTLMLLTYALGLWFFTQNSHLVIRSASELFLQKLQTILWAILSIWTCICGVYFSLAYFKGAVFDRMFTQESLTPYVQWIPLLWAVVSLGTLFAASQLSIHFSFKKEVSPPSL